jgi:hypothetical protein
VNTWVPSLIGQKFLDLITNLRGALLTEPSDGHCEKCNEDDLFRTPIEADQRSSFIPYNKNPGPGDYEAKPGRKIPGIKIRDETAREIVTTDEELPVQDEIEFIRDRDSIVRSTSGTFNLRRGTQ